MSKLLKYKISPPVYAANGATVVISIDYWVFKA